MHRPSPQVHNSAVHGHFLTERVAGASVSSSCRVARAIRANVDRLNESTNILIHFRSRRCARTVFLPLAGQKVCEVFGELRCGFIDFFF